MLRAAQCPTEQVVLVCDNAPCHVGLEEVVEEEEFRGAQLLRLGPYSAPLNPIEEVWSVVKAAMKRQLTVTNENLLLTPQDITQVEHRLHHFETAIDEAMPLVTPILCMHSAYLQPRAATLCRLSGPGRAVFE